VGTRLPRSCSPRRRVRTTKACTLDCSGYVLSNLVLESHLAPPRRPTERTCPIEPQTGRASKIGSADRALFTTGKKRGCGRARDATGNKGQEAEGETE
jgi:hypothetical protein